MYLSTCTSPWADLLTVVKEVESCKIPGSRFVLLRLIPSSEKSFVQPPVFSMTTMKHTYSHVHAMTLKRHCQFMCSTNRPSCGYVYQTSPARGKHCRARLNAHADARLLEQRLIHGRRAKHQKSVKRQKKVEVNGAIVTERLAGSEQVKSQRVTVDLRSLERA